MSFQWRKLVGGLSSTELMDQKENASDPNAKGNSVSESASVAVNASQESVNELEKKWRKGIGDPDFNPLTPGTICKCGTHSNVPWLQGGKEWLADHVKSQHPEAVDWKAAIRHALSLSPAEGAAFLSRLVDE